MNTGHFNKHVQCTYVLAKKDGLRLTSDQHQREVEEGVIESSYSMSFLPIIPAPDNGEPHTHTLLPVDTRASPQHLPHAEELRRTPHTHLRGSQQQVGEEAGDDRGIVDVRVRLR